MIRFGPAGSSGIGNLKGIELVKELGLDALEVEFTYGVRMQIPVAEQIGKLAKDLGIRLSVHAPYYINLASEEKEKISASKKRIIDSCIVGDRLGAKAIVFHAGFYQKKDPEEIYQTIKEGVV